MHQNELIHYGVLGMKWGKRKAKGYVTVRQASKNAKAAMDTARKESIAKDKARSKAGERVTYRQASKNANEAMKTARKESIAKDKAYNKQQRDEGKADKNGLSDKQKKALKVGAAVAGTVLAAYGTYKVSKFIKDKNAEIMTKKGEEIANKYLKDNTVGWDITKFRDGTSTVVERHGRSGSVGYTKFKDHASADVYRQLLEKNNAAVVEKATDLSLDYYKKGQNAGLVEATKNVYDHYRKKRRG